jgi:hypothetical protein
MDVITAMKTAHTPIFDGLVIQGGFDPDALRVAPVVAPRLTKRQRHNLAKDAQRVADGVKSA